MRTNYAQQFSRKVTPQSEPIPGSTQVANTAGGYSWEIDDWGRLDRFLIMGAEGGTYYIKEQDLIKQNHDAVLRCIKADGAQVVRRTVEISDSGRAPKNDPAIFVLALCIAHGDKATKELALESVYKVCRIGTHLFHFCEFVNALRGWGRGLRRGVGAWYTVQRPEDLAYQVIKYQSRDKWSHKDVLRLTHQRPSPGQEAVFRWIIGGKDARGPRSIVRKYGERELKSEYPLVAEFPAIIDAFEQAKVATKASEIVKLITDHNLPREAIPTQWLNEVEVWDALLQKMPVMAMVRNLGKMTSIGLIKPLTEASKLVVRKLKDAEALKKARLHPISVLLALRTYEQGHGDKGSLTWSPVQPVVQALDDAFYATFSNVVPTGKPIVYGIDTSGSMSWECSKIGPITAAEASAALALVSAATEQDYHIMAFSTGMVNIPIRPKMRLSEALQKTAEVGGGGTDCAQPMLWAMQNKVKAGAFIVLTDSETWAGAIHPKQALEQYRGKYTADARLVVVGMTSNGFTINDPGDKFGLDVVGFDASVPSLMADFIR